MGKKIDNLKWCKYRPYDKVEQGVYLCKLDKEKMRFLTYDSVWGWTADWDEYDQPHFVYDWYLEYAKVSDKDMKAVKKELAQIEHERYEEELKREAEFLSYDIDDDEEDGWMIDEWRWG